VDPSNTNTVFTNLSRHTFDVFCFSFILNQMSPVDALVPFIVASLIPVSEDSTESSCDSRFPESLINFSSHSSCDWGGGVGVADYIVLNSTCQSQEVGVFKC